MVPRYRTLADALREQIATGALPPGALLPSADKLAWEHNVGRDTALKAMALLRREGLLYKSADNAILVGPAPPHPARPAGPVGPPELVDLPANAVVRARMPTPKERDVLGVAEGVPVLVVCVADVEEVHAGDRTAMRWPTA